MSSPPNTMQHYEGFDPRFKPRLESLRCLRCLMPISATHESRGRSSVCAWCAGERTDQQTHWCERGGHRHRLIYEDYNQDENLWDCGLCLNYAFGLESMPALLNSGAPGLSASTRQSSNDGALSDGKDAHARRTNKSS